MTSPAPTRLLCAPWITPADLPATRPALDEPVWVELCWQASEQLYQLSGRQYAGECASTVLLDAPPRQRDCWPVWRPVAGWPVTAQPARPVREGYVVVSLPDPPVTAVDEVVIGSDPVAYGAELPAGLVWLDDGRAWPLDGTTAITYRHGIGPPTGGVQSAISLALELGKARTDPAACKLPKRITQLQREGVSVALMDAGEHLDKHRTGLLDVDAWLMSVNPYHLSRRTSVWSPDRPRTRKVTS